MNTSKIRVLALLSLTAALGPVAVYAQNPTSFVIPFTFTVGPKTLEPGVYQVAEVAHQVLLISDSKRHGQALLSTNTGTPGKVPDKVILTFRKYGDRYFLARMKDPERGWELPVSRAEKEFMAQQSTTTTIYASASIHK